MLRRAPARDRARRVVVLERPARPAHAGCVGPLCQRRAHQPGGEAVGIEEVETVGRIEMRLAFGKGAHFRFGFLAADFGDSEDRIVFVGQRAHPLDETGDVGMRHVVDPALEIERARARPVGRGRGRIVAQLRIVHREIERVDPEPVDPAVEPEARHREHRVLHCGIVHVELRLAAEEIVQIILPPTRVPGPGRAAEHRLPVRRRRTVGLGIGPHIPVGFRIVARGAAFDEPVMRVGRVRINLVDQQFEAERMRARDQRVEIRQRAENRIDIAIIGDVVAEILHRRSEEGRNPDRIDAELGDMVEPAGNAGQIADPVAVRIHEAARIDLVDRRAAPPWLRNCRFGRGAAGGRHHPRSSFPSVSSQAA